MRVPGAWRLKRLGTQITSPLRSRVLVLLYHRVFEPELDPAGICVSRKHFAEHMEHLSKHYNLVGLDDMVGKLNNGGLRGKSVVVTFDDGYADNLWNAQPILERFEVPTTVFVATGYIGTAREFWWDELARLVLLSQKLPDPIRVTIRGSGYEWSLCQGAPRAGSSDSDGLWYTENPSNPSPRQLAYLELQQMLRPLSEAERDAVLDQLREQAAEQPFQRPDYRALNHSELSSLASHELIEIGAHTVTHPVLSSQPVDAQRREMIESKLELENLTGRSITSFAYPYGDRDDRNDVTAMLVREAGFESACTTLRGLVTKRSDLFDMPRFTVRDSDGDEFARNVSESFSA